jgi:hypothetical protein
LLHLLSESRSWNTLLLLLLKRHLLLMDWRLLLVNLLLSGCCHQWHSCCHCSRDCL